MHAKSLQSCPTLCDPVDCRSPGSLFMGFSRQEYWSGLPCPFTEEKKNVYMCVCVCVCVCVCIERETERDTERQRERQRKRKISNHHHNSTLECLHHSHKISLSSSGGHAFLLPQIVFLSLSLFFCLF